MAEKIRKPSFTRFKIKNDGDGHFIVSFDGTAQEEVILSTMAVVHLMNAIDDIEDAEIMKLKRLFMLLPLMDKEKRESELARMLAESTFIHGGD